MPPTQHQTTMKAIQINIDGVTQPRFSAISNEEFGFCFVTEKAFNFIKAQSIDNVVYYTTGEPCDNMFASANGDIQCYSVKGNVHEDTFPFAVKEGEWEWRIVELRVIDIMD